MKEKDTGDTNQPEAHVNSGWLVSPVSFSFHYEREGYWGYQPTRINMRFGLVGIPSILLFHNGKVVAKYNDSEPTLDGFVSFIHKVTGINPLSSPILIEEDNLGPVPT